MEGPVDSWTIPQVSKVPVFYCFMKNIQITKFLPKKICGDFQQISMSLVKIGKKSEKIFFGKNFVIWIFSLNSKKQGLYL